MSTTGVPNPAAHIDVSVIVLNWNTLEITAAAIASLREHTNGISYELMLIDNGSTRDASATELPRRFPWARFIANQQNQGFCAGCNQGIRLARGRYVLLLNSDTVQTENAIGAAVSYMDQQPDVGALGILHRNHDEGRTPQPSAFGFPDPWSETWRILSTRRGGGSPGWDAEAMRDVDWCCGSFLLIRRECLDDVGGLDESFFSYDEDIDWCRRAWTKGWKVRFWPGASMIHLGSASGRFIQDKTFVVFRNRLAYYRKHHSFPGVAAFYLAMGVRLTGATVAQLARVLVGRGSTSALRERLDRQLQFVLLRPGRSRM